VHDVREASNEPQPGTQGGEEQIMDDAPDTGDAQKYDELLKNSDKPLAALDVHETIIIYLIPGYLRPKIAWNGYRCILSIPDR
jgi:hypothetical protein